MTTPFPYQLKGVRKIHHFKGRALLADEMGLGKSLQALLYAKEKPEARPVVIVCPASLKYNWEREAAKHVKMKCDILEGMKPPKRKRLHTHHEIIIINYDILGAWLPYIDELQPKLIILDECQYIKNPKAKRTQWVRALCRKKKHILGLSGTPLTNRPIELFPILNILHRKLYKSRLTFGQHYCGGVYKRWGWEFKGATNLDELHEDLLASMMIRRRVVDVLKELPTKSRHVVPLPIKNPKEYNFALKDFLGWLRKKGASRAIRAAKAERMVKMNYLKQLVAELKLPAVIEWIDNFLEETDGKLLVFGEHHNILKPLHRRYKDQSVLVNGEISKRKRQLAIDKFQHKKHIRLLFGNDVAAGVGLNLTAANTVAFAELFWTPGQHTQIEARALRIGQKQKVRCYYLVAHGTMEEMLCRIIQKKQEVSEHVLDGKGSGDSLDIHDQLEHELLQRKTNHE